MHGVWVVRSLQGAGNWMRVRALGAEHTEDKGEKKRRAGPEGADRGGGASQAGEGLPLLELWQLIQLLQCKPCAPASVPSGLPDTGFPPVP